SGSVTPPYATGTSDGVASPPSSGGPQDRIQNLSRPSSRCHSIHDVKAPRNESLHPLIRYWRRFSDCSHRGRGERTRRGGSIARTTRDDGRVGDAFDAMRIRWVIVAGRRWLDDLWRSRRRPRRCDALVDGVHSHEAGEARYLVEHRGVS